MTMSHLRQRRGPLPILKLTENNTKLWTKHCARTRSPSPPSSCPPGPFPPRPLSPCPSACGLANASPDTASPPTDASRTEHRAASDTVGRYDFSAGLRCLREKMLLTTEEGRFSVSLALSENQYIGGEDNRFLLPTKSLGYIFRPLTLLVGQRLESLCQ
jgi:hypothetical protein